MSKMTVSLAGGKYVTDVDYTDVKELVEKLSELSEVFEQKHYDGKDIRFVVREVDGNKFYELLCPETGEKLSFGCHKKGNTLFPKRVDADGKFIGKQGWHKFVPDTKKETK